MRSFDWKGKQTIDIDHQAMSEMSLTSEGPPAKRPESDQIPTTEQPEPKRPKIGDPQLPVDTAVAMDLQSDDDYSDWDDPLEHVYDESYGYCIVCRKIVSSHSPEECPNKAKAFGMFCFECMGPCKLSTDEHKEHQAERIKMCSNCVSQGRHWTQDCPYPDDSD